MREQILFMTLVSLLGHLVDSESEIHIHVHTQSQSQSQSHLSRTLHNADNHSHTRMNSRTALLICALICFIVFFYFMLNVACHVRRRGTRTGAGAGAGAGAIGLSALGMGMSPEALGEAIVNNLSTFQRRALLEKFFSKDSNSDKYDDADPHKVEKNGDKKVKGKVNIEVEIVVEVEVDVVVNLNGGINLENVNDDSGHDVPATISGPVSVPVPVTPLPAKITSDEECPSTPQTRIMEESPYPETNNSGHDMGGFLLSTPEPLVPYPYMTFGRQTPGSGCRSGSGSDDGEDDSSSNRNSPMMTFPFCVDLNKATDAIVKIGREGKGDANTIIEDQHQKLEQDQNQNQEQKQEDVNSESFFEVDVCAICLDTYGKKKSIVVPCLAHYWYDIEMNLCCHVRCLCTVYFNFNFELMFRFLHSIVILYHTFTFYSTDDPDSKVTSKHCRHAFHREW